MSLFIYSFQHWPVLLFALGVLLHSLICTIYFCQLSLLQLQITWREKKKVSLSKKMCSQGNYKKRCCEWGLQNKYLFTSLFIAREHTFYDHKKETSTPHRKEDSECLWMPLNAFMLTAIMDARSVEIQCVHHPDQSKNVKPCLILTRFESVKFNTFGKLRVNIQ